MTVVKLHGILAKTFGDTFKLRLGRLSDVFLALDATLKNFRKKFNELISKGYSYSYYIFNNEIHIAPIIGGSGKTAIIIIAIILIVVAFLLIAFVLGPALMAAMSAASAAAATTGTTFAATTMTGLLMGGGFAASGVGFGLATAGFLTGMVLSQGISLLVSGLTMPEMPSPGSPQNYSLGGSASSAIAGGRSYIFGNTNNQAAQGISIPIGYGRLKCVSKVIQVSTKNQNTNFDFIKENALLKAEQSYV